MAGSSHPSQAPPEYFDIRTGENVTDGAADVTPASQGNTLPIEPGEDSWSDADSTMRPPPAQLRRINLEGDAVPGSQDSDLASLTRDHLHMSDDNGLRVATPAPALPPR